MQYEDYYANQHSGRKLTWLHQLSTGELKTNYLRRSYTISVTTYQLAILLAYNGTVEHSYSALAQITGLQQSELIATVQSLVDARLITMDTEGVSGRGLCHVTFVSYL